MLQPENSAKLLERLTRVMTTIDGYKDAIHPEAYRELIEDLMVVKFNVTQLNQLIDDSMLHREHSLKTLFAMAKTMID